jgi:glycine cleavage system H lipoate-binding protein
VKLTSLFAQYLYTNHRLDLPGIGTFVLDPSTIASIDNSKQKSIVLSGVSFEYNTSVKESPELIAFISSQSGKMKALASADLESFVQQAQQFLNIGKPFELEGIGILVKKQKGEFVFTPLTVPTEKLKEHKTKEPTPVTLEESSAQYESFLGSPKANTGWRKPVIALLIIAGAALAIWGGYTISRKAATADVTEVVDTTHVITPTDTVVAIPEPVKPKDYKYILQVSRKNTALRRYKQLRENLWDVGMETKDSVDYKLFLLLPMRTDTTHVVDSLTALTGKKVYIEYQN